MSGPCGRSTCPAFKMAVKDAGALAVMAAYNKVRGDYCAENDYLLNKVLKGEWGFKGFVISDWGGVHTTEGAVLGGLDIEMGTGGRSFDQYYLATPFLEGLKSGNIPTSVVDDKARRHLYVMFKLKMFDAAAGEQAVALNTPEHHAAARDDRRAEHGAGEERIEPPSAGYEQDQDRSR